MKKSIEFELKGEQINHVASFHIIDILEKHLGIEVYTLPIVIKELDEINFSNYYLDGNVNNPKITKPIKKILLKYFPEKKDLINEKYPRICHEIASLYHPTMKLKSFWGDKSLLGEGVYEPYTTCFGKDGCNHTSRKFIEGINRVKTLVIVLKETLDFFPLKRRSKTSRCLAYFAGDRSVYLTNFYYQGIPQNKRIFVEALRRILGLVKVSWKEDSFPLEMIYLNHDCIRVKTDGIEKREGIKYPSHVNCPVCTDKVPFKQIRYETQGNNYLIGCSDECLGEDKITCDSCGDCIDEDDRYSSPNGDGIYCQSCYSDLYSYCEHCGNDVDKNYMVGDYCQDCAYSCSDCGDEVLKDKFFEFEGEFYCEHCYTEKVGVCEICSSDVKRNDLKEFDGDNYCEDCYEKKVGVCKNCDTETYRSELTKHEGDYICGDCLMDRTGREEEENELESPIDEKENSI